MGPIAAASVGAVLRLWNLGEPDALVFDETYYAKDALALLRFGVERGAIEGADDILLGSSPDAWSADIFTEAPAFIVHPPVGKWLIGAGELLFGATPTGWRIAAAVAGTLCILLLGRVVMRLTGNALLATIAAGLLALDGFHIVMSRTALLDGFLMLFVLAAFAALLIDRDRGRELYLTSGVPLGVRWWRGWRLAAGILLGLACGVKWSALWYLIALGLLVFAWEAGNRKAAGAARPWRSALRRDAVPAFVSIAVVAGAVYLATWSGWLLADDGWGRQWRPDEGSPWIPQPLAALWHYHVEIYRFHVGLDEEHPYEASAWGWLLQARPTSFYYDNSAAACGAARCSAAITSLGNPLIWWPAVAALLHQAYRAVLVRDWRSSAVVVGVLAGWVPWLLYPDRTTFSFYSVVLLPFLIAALTLSLGQILGTTTSQWRTWRIGMIGAYLAAVVIAAWWFYPVWTGQEIPYDAWRLRMWLPSWV